MPYTSFAVAGAGPTVGGRVVQALIQRGASVVVLTRPRSTSAASPLLEGAQIATVDYTNDRALASVLREHKVEVVVSAMAHRALAAQWPIAEAAKAAGVQLFVPSEYGMPTEGCKEEFLLIKHQFADYVASLGIPVMRVYTGLFIEYVPGLLGIKRGTCYLLGDQTAPGSLTSLDDIAGFVAHVLTTLPNASLANATFRIEGERTTLAAIGALYEARNPPVPVTHLARTEQFPEELSMDALLQAIFGTGRVSSGWDNYTGKDVPENANSGNKAWEGHKWKSVKEVLGL